jgi:hypothetical protein
MLLAATPSDFVNTSTILTFGGSTAGIIAINVAARKVFRVNHPGVPFGAALVLAFALAASQGVLNTLIGWVVALVNACMLFCASIGANEIATDAATPKPAGKGEQQGKERKKSVAAFTSFFRKGPAEARPSEGDRTQGLERNAPGS